MTKKEVDKIVKISSKIMDAELEDIPTSEDVIWAVGKGIKISKKDYDAFKPILFCQQCGLNGMVSEKNKEGFGFPHITQEDDVYLSISEDNLETFRADLQKTMDWIACKYKRIKYSELAAKLEEDIMKRQVAE